jgi:hypothetical protein
MLPDYWKSAAFSGTRGFSVPNPTGGHSFRRPFPFSLPAVENRLVLDSALDILFKTDQYVFAIHSRPRNSELRDRISQVLYPSNLDGQQKVYWHDVHQAGVAAGEGLCYTPPRRASCPIAGSF